MVLRSAIVLGALSAAAGCVAISGSDLGKYVEREEKRFSTAGRPDVELSTFDGSIEIDGRIELRSGDGSIRGHDISGNLNVQTGDGSITVDGKFAGLHAHSGDGSVRIHAIAGVDASSDWEISTGDGSVTLELPDGFNADLDAHTGDGGIHVHDMTLSNVTGEIKRISVRGRLGSGGRLLRVRTGDGSITLRRS